jgi:DNA-binding transcriptional MerR regulator/effector-binding domain-containing protein
VFRIGEFSKIAQVSMRMLRHYDAIGLFHPERVDATSGYRYYSARQLPAINRIVALRMLGMSLDEIGRIVAGGLDAHEVRGIYRTRKAELESRIEEERRMLAYVETRLARLDEGAFAESEAVLKRAPTQTVVALRERVADFGVMGNRLLEVHRVGLAHDRLGPTLAVFHDPDFETEGVDWEVGLALTDDGPERLPLPDGSHLVRRTLPAIERCASTVHEGAFDGLHLGYGALGTWIERSGLEVAGVGREIFWHLDPDRPERNVTEIQFPVRERAPATPARATDPAVEAS